MSTKQIIQSIGGRKLYLTKTRLVELPRRWGFFLKLSELSKRSITTVWIAETVQEPNHDIRMRILVPFKREQRRIGCHTFDSKNFRLIMSAVRGTKKAMAAAAGAQ